MKHAQVGQARSRTGVTSEPAPGRSRADRPSRGAATRAASHEDATGPAQVSGENDQASAARDLCGVERVHAVAYAFYEARGCVDGHDLDDWLAAESAVAREAQDGPGSEVVADH